MTVHEIFTTGTTFRNTQKMPALFMIDREAHKTLMEINPAAAWLFDEEATATQKRDGVGVLVGLDGEIMIRRQVKRGKIAPVGFVHAETDPNTGSMFGVEPVKSSGRGKAVTEALEDMAPGMLQPGTYELVGPAVNGNPEKVEKHKLIRHGEPIEFIDMREFAGVDAETIFKQLTPIFTEYRDKGIEGIVWYGADGKRVKLRVNDFFGDPNRR